MAQSPLKGPQLPPVPARPTSALLKVAPEFQNDNQSGQGYRECFSSSCAMLARFHGRIQSDDAYNKIRARFGDTTSNVAQIKALESLGLRSSFSVNNGFPQLEAEILAGFPMAVGWLHHGVVTAPRGGGHWSVVIGFTAQGIIHHDPNGEADMIMGGYVNRGKGGAGVAYSRKNWGRRWMCNERGIYTPGRNGWMLTCRP